MRKLFFLHQQLIDLPTSPVSCSHFTLENTKKSFFNNIIHTDFWLVTLSQNKTNCNRDCELTHHTWKISPHYLVKCRTHSEGILFPSKRWLWKGELCCAALVAVNRSSRLMCCVWTCMSRKQRHSQCSKWPPSPEIHVSSFFRHWLIASSTIRSAEIQLMSRQAAVAAVGNWMFTILWNMVWP